MKLKPLSCERYTIWELLEYLGLEDYDWDLIRDHVIHGNIQMQGRVGGTGTWIDVPPNDFDDDDFLTFTCTREEAERFEKEHGLNQPAEDTENRPPESPCHFVERSLAEGTSREQVALELEAQGVKVDVIGRLLCNRTLSGLVDTDSYSTLRKRGYDLLVKAKK